MEIWYSYEHTWVKTDAIKLTGIIGITDYFAEGIGKVDFIDFPDIGSVVKQGGQIVMLNTSVGKVRVLSPVSGVITEINACLESFPEILETTPESDGFLLKIKIADLNETSKLLKRYQYLERLKKA
jgi:glycine cleavage system H protein